VVKNLRSAGLGVADPAHTLFTFDCNPGGSDQGYAANVFDLEPTSAAAALVGSKVLLDGPSKTLTGD
jgi:hypothetical protein